MIKTLGWTSLEDRRIEYRLKLIEKFRNGDLYNEIRDIIIPIISDRNFRNQTSKELREIIARTESYHRSFFPDSVRRINRIDK